MDAASKIGLIGSLVGDQARARMLSAMLDGRAHTATELAWAADIAPSTASSHLGKLADANLVAVEKQGRHRYFRLAGGDVAAALEALLRLDGPKLRVLETGPRDIGLQQARTCYDHLAGKIAVQMAAAMVEKGYLREGSESFDVTPAGASWLEEVDIGPIRMSRRRFAPRCLDWSERRAHVAGALGALSVPNRSTT